MPVSTPVHLSHCLNHIIQLSPQSVLDVGCGFGMWGFLCRTYLDAFCERVYKKDWRVRIDGIEYFEPYILEHQRARYDSIQIGDIRDLIANIEPYERGRGRIPAGTLALRSGPLHSRVFKVKRFTVPDGAAAVADPIAGVDVGAFAAGGGVGFMRGGVGVSADDGFGLALGEQPPGVGAQGERGRTGGRVGRRLQRAARVADGAGDAHGPVGVDEPEQGNGQGIARDAFEERVDAVIGIDAVPVYEVNGLSAERQVDGVLVDVETKFVF